MSMVSLLGGYASMSRGPSCLQKSDVCDTLVRNNVSPADLCGRDLSFLRLIVHCDAADPEKRGQFRDSDILFISHAVDLNANVNLTPAA